MYHRYGVFSLLLPIAVFFFAAPAVRLAAQDAVHVVAKGETVYSISRSYRVSPDELMRYNGINDPSKLQAGKALRIPSGSAGIPSSGTQTVGSSTIGNQTASGTAGYTEYRVEKNDTLFSIARNHGVTLQALREINGFSPDFSQIKAGDRLKIPAGASNAGVASGRTTGTTVTAVRPNTGGEIRPAEIKQIDSSVRWPVMPKEIAYLTGKLYGVVLNGERFESVKSLTAGTVFSAGPYRGWGRVAIVEVTGGYWYVYGGCESLSVKVGEKIGPGMELGKLGVDVHTGKPQLFFLVYKGNAPIDPAKAPRA